MDKEQILAMSRQENQNKDLYELEINKKATEIASIASTIVCAVLYMAEILICGNKNFGLWSVIAAFIAGKFLYMGIRSKNANHTALGVIWAIIFVIAAVSAIVNLFATSTIL
ncbi:MAG: hypothetical protein IJZ95_02830 [Oscillospiraceae bacterium]|nr:hypothetical protein [Oscillospiraceae bacterium]